MSTIDLSTTPLQDPPTGIEKNLTNPPTIATTIYVTTSLILAISASFVALRCYTRIILLRKFMWSDYVFLSGYLLTIINSALLMAACKYGLGRKPWNIPLDMFFPELAKNLWVQRVAYALSLAALKIAILCFYPQLNPSKRFQFAVCILVGLVILLTACALMLDIFLCWPVSAAWDFRVAMAHPCKDFQPYIVFTGALNVGTDLAILVLPVAMLWNVRLAKKKKIAVALLLATGSLILRVVYSIELGGEHDATYVKVAMWSNAEIHSAVVCACLPTLKPFIRSFFPSLWLSTAKRSETPHSVPIILPEQQQHVRPNDGMKNTKISDRISEQYVVSDVQGASKPESMKLIEQGLSGVGHDHV